MLQWLDCFLPAWPAGAHRAPLLCPEVWGADTPCHYRTAMEKTEFCFPFSRLHFKRAKLPKPMQSFLILRLYKNKVWDICRWEWKKRHRSLCNLWRNRHRGTREYQPAHMGLGYLTLFQRFRKERASSVLEIVHLWGVCLFLFYIAYCIWNPRCAKEVPCSATLLQFMVWNTITQLAGCCHAMCLQRLFQEQVSDINLRQWVQTN